MSFFCFQSHNHVFNLRILFPIYFDVSNLFWCFQSTMFPMYVSNLHITVLRVLKPFKMVWLMYEINMGFIWVFHGYNMGIIWVLYGYYYLYAASNCWKSSFSQFFFQVIFVIEMAIIRHCYSLNSFHFMSNVI